jgi:hypothetical protein
MASPQRSFSTTEEEMDLAPYLPALKYIHVLAALGFLLAHGTSAAVSMRLRNERDRSRMVAYLELSGSTFGAAYLALLVLFVGGIISGIAGGYWTSGQWWLWLSLALFLGLAIEMSFVRWRYYLGVRTALGVAPPPKDGIAPPPANDEELARVLASPLPALNLGLALVVVAILTWLMMFKPF